MVCFPLFYMLEVSCYKDAVAVSEIIQSRIKGIFF